MADGVIANREHLLDAAETLIRAKGPDVSLQAIAAHAGVTKPCLYREVGDRDELLKQLGLRLAQRMAATVNEFQANSSGPREFLRGLIAGYLRLSRGDEHIYAFVTAGVSGNDRVQQTLLLADRAASRFVKPIARYREQLGEDPEVAMVWAYGLLGAMHFVTLWWLREPSLDIEIVIDQLTTLLWSGMGMASSHGE